MSVCILFGNNCIFVGNRLHPNMGFLVNGTLRAPLGHHVYEPLDKIKVKFYRSKEDEITGDGDMPRLLSPEQVASLEMTCLGNTQTDDSGNYTCQMKDGYRGEPMEVHLEIARVPFQKGKQGDPIQVKLATIRPLWRKNGEEHCYHWNQTLSYRLWHRIRSTFDAWTILGSVRNGKLGKTPLHGVEVFAYDADWVRDDFLGNGTTDGKGRFRIDYTSADFKKTFLTPLINVETPLVAIPGPGVYFQIKSPDGRILYKEPRSFGKREDRKNIPNCFHVELEIDA